jgi:hypothetical protein
VIVFGFSFVNSFFHRGGAKAQGRRKEFFLCRWYFIFGNSMSKINIKEHHYDNPFLTDKADDLWRQLDKGGKPVSKEEFLENKGFKEKKGFVARVIKSYCQIFAANGNCA